MSSRWSSSSVGKIWLFLPDPSLPGWLKILHLTAKLKRWFVYSLIQHEIVSVGLSYSLINMKMSVFVCVTHYYSWSVLCWSVSFLKAKAKVCVDLKSSSKLTVRESWGSWGPLPNLYYLGVFSYSALRRSIYRRETPKSCLQTVWLHRPIG